MLVGQRADSTSIERRAMIESSTTEAARTIIATADAGGVGGTAAAVGATATNADVQHGPVSRAVLRVVLLSTVLAVCAAFLLTTTDVGANARTAPWWMTVVVFIAFGMAERFAFHVEYRREAMSFTLSEVPTAYALLFLDPVVAVAIRVTASLLVIGWTHRPAPYKLYFNSAWFAYEMALAVAIMEVLNGDARQTDGRLLIVILIAIMLSSLTGPFLVSTAISYFEGKLLERLSGELRQAAVLGPIGAAVAAVALAPAFIGPKFAILAIVPVGAVWVVLRQFGKLAERHRDLKAVHDFVRRIGASIRLDELSPLALVESMRVLRANRGMLTVIDLNGATVVTAVALADGHCHLFRSGETPPPAVAREIAALHQPELPETLCWREGNCVSIPIADGEGAVGSLVLAGRTGVRDTFDAEDLARADVVASQLAVNLRNSLLHERVERDALTDALTGEHNRIAFDRLVSAAASNPGRTLVGAVLMLDLDRFKEVNDTLGHQAGDVVLIEFAGRLRTQLHTGDLLARFGGDEFAIYVERDGVAAIIDLAQRILDGSHIAFALDGFNVAVNASVGVAIVTSNDRDAEDIIRRADIAMYTAKADHSGVELYHDAIDRRTPERLSLLGDLRHALETGELHVHYQPKMNLETSTIVGVEALARWLHPTRGWVAPEEFIRVAEETGLIKGVTDYVLSTAIRDARMWSEAGFDLDVAVNLSTLDLVDELLVDRIDDRLGEHQFASARLTLEITESSLMIDTPRTMLTIERLDRLGVILSLDDFGTGYSSLSYLRRLPVAELKIDRSFISNLLLDTQDEAIVTSTIALGHSLGLRIVAEGVECEQVVSRLTELGCDVAQGFGISRALSITQLQTWLKTTDHGVRRHSDAATRTTA